MRHLHIDDRIAGDHAVLHGLLNALVHGGDELTRDGAADDAVHEFVALAGGIRLDLEPDVTVLAAATGLAHELALRLDRAADRLAIGDLWLADVGLDLELTLHAVDDDFEVQLTHTGDDGLPDSSSVCTRNDGSSCARRCSAIPIFS